MGMRSAGGAQGANAPMLRVATAAQAAEGTELEIDVRGKVRGARVARKPLYAKP